MHIVYYDIKNFAIKHRTYILFMMLDTAFYREKLNENRLLFLFIMSADMHSLRFHLGN